MRAFTNGAEAIVRGALQAECDFFAGYPITPATPILQHMIYELPKAGGVAIQAEDEIAAFGMCIGAAMAGSRAMTATSGPGISLFSENIGAAIMLETPLVIVDVQRMGPATGGATTTAQGDVQFLRWGTSGGFPVIVLCPTGIAECYRLIQKAFDLAARFRSPVFLAVDKHIVMDSATVETADFQDVPKTKPLNIGHPHTPIGGTRLVRATTSSHDELGYLVKDPIIMDQLNRRLAAKIEDHLAEIADVKADLQSGAEILLVSYGITAGAADEAVLIARRNGLRVSSLTLHSLWPVPEVEIAAALVGIRRVVVPELNLGQYRREIERLVKDQQGVIGVNRVDGRLITPDEIVKALA